MRNHCLPIAVISAGPVGLAAAAHLLGGAQETEALVFAPAGLGRKTGV